MAPDTFSPFPRLPLELRRQIYLLATPPRVVHVKETPRPSRGIQKQFREQLLDFPPLNVDPSLNYFAHNWRRFLIERSQEDRSSLRQTLLKSFNFKGPEHDTSQEPSESFPTTPEFDILQLWDNPTLVWNFCRKGHLSSSANIPPLLHTCRESRQILMDHGYHLAFKTRTAEPRTWFCFKDDILFLETTRDTSGYASRLLDGGDFNIGQFDPEELKKIRRLAISGVHPDEPCDTYEVSNALRLIPGLEELLWVSVSVNRLQYEWLSAGEDTATGFKNHEAQCGCGLDYMACDASELTEKSIAWCEPWWYQWVRAGNLQNEQQDDSHVKSSFTEISRVIHQRLTDQRDNVVRDDDASEWNIPTVNLVHLGSSHLLELLRRERARCKEKDEEKKQYELFWRFDGGFC